MPQTLQLSALKMASIDDPSCFDAGGFDILAAADLMHLSESQPGGSPPPPILTESQTGRLFSQEGEARLVLTPADEGAGPGPSSEQLAGVAAEVYNMLQERCGSMRPREKQARQARLKRLIASKPMDELMKVHGQLKQDASKITDEVQGAGLLLDFWTSRAGVGARVVSGKPQKADLVLVDPAGGPSVRPG